jgi:nitrogen regulatory protein P-II 1
MKLITAVVTPPEFEAVKKALDIFGITGLTITEVFQRDLIGASHDQIYRGRRFHVGLLPHIRIELVTADHDTTDIIHIITKLTSPRGSPENIWITPVETLTRVRTGERGTDAL